MPQLQLPIFSEEIQHLTSEIGFRCQGGQVTYFNGQLPIFTHAQGDMPMFRTITSQWMDQGLVKQSEVARTFGVPLRSVKRYLSIYRAKGLPGLYAPKPRRRGHKLTAERLVEVQEKLHQGLSVPQISEEVGILPSTLHKAIDAGRLQQFKKKKKL
jgi:hypothetical protein